MQRVHLEEDLHLIQKYFPGARPVALHTPFDLTDKPRLGQNRVLADEFLDDQDGSWCGDLSWSR